MPAASVAVEGVEGGTDAQAPKQQLLDDSDRPRFEDSRGERFFCYGVGLFVALVGVVVAALIGAGVIGLGDGTRTLHVAVRWIAFPIVLGLSLMIGTACMWLLMRECSAVRQAEENEMLEEEMQEGVTATQGYLRMDEDKRGKVNNDFH